MQFKSAVVAGATGLIGKSLVYQLLESNHYSRVTVLVRRPMNIKHPKLTVAMVNFDDTESYHNLLLADDFYCCMGTTIKDAGSQDAFRKVDYTYPIELAKAAKTKGVNRFFMITAMGADVNSGIFYNRVKGELENELKAIGFGYLGIFRPSLLLGYRSNFRMGEWIAQKLMKPLSFLFFGPLLNYKPIDGFKVAKSMLLTSISEKHGVEIIENQQMHLMTRGK
jgi:uncharacterized protein YbjT (DUF2867 family)